VLGNIGTAEDVAALTRALGDDDPLAGSGPGQAVREHAAWALGRLTR
jgi:HEAT repeat protein